MRHLQTYESFTIGSGFSRSDISGMIQDIFVDICEDEKLDIKVGMFKKIDEADHISEFNLIIKKTPEKANSWEQQFMMSSDLVKTIMFCVNYLSENGVEIKTMFTEDDTEVIEIPIENKNLEVPEDVDKKYSVNIGDYLNSIKDDNSFSLVELEFKITKA